MRARSLAAVVLYLLTVACAPPQHGAAASNQASCIDASAPHRAYLVVQHLSGASLERCVGFSTATIDGQALMDRSGIEYRAEAVAAGWAVCELDGEPRGFAPCAAPDQRYWALFVLQAGTWEKARGGFTGVTLHDQEALGWRYVEAADTAPSPPPSPRRAGG